MRCMIELRVNAQVNQRRSAKGTNTGHENAEGIASVGVCVEPPVSPMAMPVRIFSSH